MWAISKAHYFSLLYTVSIWKGLEADLFSRLKVKVKIELWLFPISTTLWPLYTEDPSTDLNQTWYTVSILQGLEAYLLSRSYVKGQGQNWTLTIFLNTEGMHPLCGALVLNTLHVCIQTTFTKDSTSIDSTIFILGSTTSNDVIEPFKLKSKCKIPI